jgi:hypothetical protein
MAIDPNIISQLKAPAIDLPEAMNAGFTGRLTRAQAANAEAQNPGIVADSYAKTRTMELQKAMTANPEQYMDVNPDDPMGPKIPNYNKVTAFLGNRGGLPEAQALAGLDIIQQKGRIENTQSIQVRDALTGKLINDGLDHASNIAKNSPPAMQIATMAKFREGMLKQLPGVDPAMFDAYWPEGPASDSPEALKARTEGMIAPETRTAQEISKENADTSRTNVGIVGDVAYAKNGALPPEVRADYVKSAFQDSSDIQLNNNARAAASNMARLGTGPGSALSAYVQKYGTQNKDAQTMHAAMANYNSKPENANNQLTDSMGMNVITNALNNQTKIKASTLHTKEKLSNTPVATGGFGGGGPVNMVNASGTVMHNVAPEHQAQLVKLGYHNQ